MKAIAYTDGRGNCSTGSCAIFMTLETGREIEFSKYLGEVSNNVAEYEGVILALQQAKKYSVTDLVIRSDAKLIVHQVRGEWRLREKTLLPLRERVWEEAESLDSVHIEWVRREKNSRADKLCREVAKNYVE